jgi:hypothetical protein
MSATDFQLDVATEQVNIFEDIELVYKNIKNFQKFDKIAKFIGNTTRRSCKYILLQKITKCMDTVYEDDAVTKNKKLQILKKNLSILTAINNSTEIFCVIIFIKMFNLYYRHNYEEISNNNFYKYNQIEIEYTIYIFNDDEYYNLFTETLMPIINAKKILNAEFHQRIHQKKQQSMHNEFLELILHPDNMPWMIDHQLIDVKFAYKN